MKLILKTVISPMTHLRNLISSLMFRIANQKKKEEVKEEPVQKEQKKEMEEYSEGVQKRIAKLTKKMREAERQKEEAVSYARRVMRERDELGKQATDLDQGYTSEMEGKN